MRRFEALDGLRGLAAAMVLFYHVGVITGHFSLFPYGYLAVDLFFVLSWFVIGSAYERKLDGGLSVWKYMLDIRVVRMYPMVLLGSVVGLTAVLVGAMDTPNPVTALGKQLVMVPTLQGHDLYVLNPVMWSLMLELVANAVHASFLRALGNRVLGLIVAVGVGMVTLAAYHYYNLNIGWGYNTILGGVARVIFSFFLGLLIYRLYALDRLPKVKLPFSVLVLVMVLAMAVPVPFVHHHIPMMHDLAAVLIVFPITVIAGTQVRMGATIKKWSEALGGLSYPLYAIHFPLVHMAFLFAAVQLSSHSSNLVFWSVFCAMMLFLAWLVDAVVERPFQNWWRQRRAQFIRTSAD